MPDKPKILIVDDKPQNLYALEKILQKLDVEVIQAISGNEALGLTLEHDFCMAIVDVQMPEMDGYELVELLRSNTSTTTLPVIFVSAIFSDEYHHRKAYDAGAVDFLSKPFIPEILLSKVRVFINLYEQRLQLEQWGQFLEKMVAQRTEELNRAYVALERIDKAKSDFITVAAHELRTPLTLIRGYANMLVDMVDSVPGAVDMVKGIVAGETRLFEIVNSMLDIARIDNATLKAHKESTQINDLLYALQKQLADTWVERNLTLNVQTVDDLPPIQADPDLLQKLFRHLIVNAIKYTPDGGTITVSGSLVHLEGNRAMAQICVADTGIGIDPAHHKLIFEKFYQTGPVQLHSSGKTKFKGGGPGLGLAIARGIVDVHGGNIWVESSGYDEKTLPGSKFYVQLPVEGG